MEDAQKVQAYFAKLDETVADIAEALRGRIEVLGRGLRVKLAWGHPCWSGNDRIFAIIAHTSYCNLQLWNGARLADRFSRIEGTGKALRHVKVRRLEQVDEGLDDIIEAAIRLDSNFGG